MATKKTWTVKVASNPTFCGVDVGGTQFANGTAKIVDERLANWFKEHDGYEVKEVKEAPKTTDESKTAPKTAPKTTDESEPKADAK